LRMSSIASWLRSLEAMAMLMRRWVSMLMRGDQHSRCDEGHPLTNRSEMERLADTALSPAPSVMP
jgi:hypothetical protein